MGKRERQKSETKFLYTLKYNNYDYEGSTKVPAIVLNSLSVTVKVKVVVGLQERFNGFLYKLHLETYKFVRFCCLYC